MKINFTRYKAHGMSKHPAYKVWCAMLSRCCSKTNAQWSDYGGRGIRVCPAWENFIQFWKDMGPTYRRGLCLERRKNNLGYSKGNCYWATRHQQGQNKRNNVYIATPWGKLCLAEAARRIGISVSTLRERIRQKWPAARIFKK